MLLALLLACSPELTDYRGGWREVECGGTTDDLGMMEVAVDIEGPRPTSAFIANGDRWYPVGATWTTDVTVTLTTGDANTDTNCRLWLAE